MAISDNKKCQTMINEATIAITDVRNALNALEAVRQKFLTHSPSTTGTVLQGNTAALSTSLNTMLTEANKAVWDTLISGYVPSHEGKALDG